MNWFNEPFNWKVQPGSSIEVITSPKTDFWRISHYNFILDNGHFYFEEVESNFVAKDKISNNYTDHFAFTLAKRELVLLNRKNYGIISVIR